MAKLKVTLSLDRGLIGVVDEAVKREVAESRSAAVEEALRLWRLEQQRLHLEHETEAYYRAMSRREWQEDRAWSRMSSRQAKRLWKE